MSTLGNAAPPPVVLAPRPLGLALDTGTDVSTRSTTLAASAPGRRTGLDRAGTVLTTQAADGAGAVTARSMLDLCDIDHGEEGA